MSFKLIATLFIFLNACGLYLQKVKTTTIIIIIIIIIRVAAINDLSLQMF